MQTAVIWGKAEGGGKWQRSQPSSSGAGISGLSAGCCGQMNGYRTQTFEMHNKTGGVCISPTHSILRG